jgi:hypothetical protein
MSSYGTVITRTESKYPTPPLLIAVRSDLSRCDRAYRGAIRLITVRSDLSRCDQTYHSAIRLITVRSGLSQCDQCYHSKQYTCRLLMSFGLQILRASAGPLAQRRASKESTYGPQ